MADLVEVKVPDIGDFDEVEVIEVLVRPGDLVRVDDSLITLESEKATMEVPSTAAGTIEELLVRVGDKVGEGSAIVRVRANAASPADQAPAPAQKVVPAAQKVVPAAAALPPPPAAVAEQRPGVAMGKRAPPDPPAAESGVGAAAPALVHASPAVRRFARELGVDLRAVRGSGAKGRVLKDDVQRFVKERVGKPEAAAAAGAFGLPPMPAPDYAKHGPVEEVALSRIRRVSGQNLHRAWLHVPHVTQFDEADVTELEAFRQSQKAAAEQRGLRLTPLAFVLKACAAALRAHPELNASLHPGGERLILKRYYHLAVAVDTSDGLVVPVNRDVHQKRIYQLARELAEASERARAGKLRPADISGATFTVSSLGGIGGTAFTPIVNAPEVAILGVARMATRPVFTNGGFVPRSMLPLCLSYDHRVIDGAMGARFIVTLAEELGDIRRIQL